jgi:hypothetical protein
MEPPGFSHELPDLGRREAKAELGREEDRAGNPEAGGDRMAEEGGASGSQGTILVTPP